MVEEGGDREGAGVIISRFHTNVIIHRINSTEKHTQDFRLFKQKAQGLIPRDSLKTQQISEMIGFAAQLQSF